VTVTRSLYGAARNTASNVEICRSSSLASAICRGVASKARASRLTGVTLAAELMLRMIVPASSPTSGVTQRGRSGELPL